ncbi:P-loop containing nucleoside triphosphate hydrolase protein [Amylostereum chailletii]|nr:P-loop containing nucleoside triphosphate hydrolase protein [Amylostereum chailletii]
MNRSSGPSASTSKRRAEGQATAPGPAAKRRRGPSKGKVAETKGMNEATKIWPEHFKHVFKAMNTVIAFVSTRQHIPMTIETTRVSIENLLKEPLDLGEVAEIKALLPNLVEFVYKPKDELRINARGKSPDFGKFIQSGNGDEGDIVPVDDDAESRKAVYDDGDEHVLVLEFNGNDGYGPRKSDHGMLSLPPTVKMNKVTKLVDERNQSFCQAVDQLISATPDDGDPVALLKAAGKDCAPVNPASLFHNAFSDSHGEEPSVVPSSEDRPSIGSVVDLIQKELWYAGEIQDKRTFEAREGHLGVLDPPFSESIQHAFLESRNISTMYSHQAEAISALTKGKDVIVSTSTASGKSVIYQAPILRFLEEDSSATALLIYPTKACQALAQDQKAAFAQLVDTYDGDTSQEDRPRIRETASVILTNFDTIHAAILPHEDLWRRFLKNLKLLVVDELHYYHDVFGRYELLVSVRDLLQRVSSHAAMTVEVVIEDGAPTGKKDFVIWDPPFVSLDARKLGKMRTAITDATGLMRYLMKRGIRVILFCKVRKTCELAMKTIRQDLTAEGRFDILDRVMAYRGGYSQHDRRKIEQEAFSGKLLGIIATNALELGVDIGVLDAVIMLGFPSNVASLRQQIGRAGRRARDALGVLVTSGDPIDQYYLSHPDDIWEKPVDDLIVNLDNATIVEAHLQCAAFEMPMRKEDQKWFGPLTVQLCEERLEKDRDGWYHTHPKFLPYPAKDVSLRGAEEEKYSLIDVTKLGQPGVVARVMEELEVSRALFELYEGGIVHEVNHDSKKAHLVRTNVAWTTKPRDVDAVQTHRIREIRNSPRLAFYGRVDIKTSVFGFFKEKNGRILDTVFVDMPPYERVSTGMWLDVSKDTLNWLVERQIGVAAAIHSAEHAILNRFSLAADLRTECIQSTLCKEYNAVTSKMGALIILRDILGLPLDSFPETWGSRADWQQTIVEAPSVGRVQGVQVEAA